MKKLRITAITLIAIALAATVAVLGSTGCSASNGYDQDVRFKRAQMETDNITPNTASYSLLVDTENDIVYLLWGSGNGQRAVAGITPLLDANGQPATTADTDLLKGFDGRFKTHNVSERNADTIIDTLTGVVYIRFHAGTGKSSIAGISALIGTDGKPVIDTEYAQSAN